MSTFRKVKSWPAMSRLAVVLSGLLLAQSSFAFIHPGIALTIADLNNIKANLKNWPWSEGYAALTSDWLSNTNYIMHGPAPYVNRNLAGNYDNESAWQSDMQAIYNQARMWYFTGDNNYAQHAHDMLLAWANTMTNFGGIEAGLDLGDYAYRYAEGADILRGTWPGWTTADTLTVSNFFRNVYLPATGLSSSTGVVGPSNKGALQMSGALACAVFMDDTNLFNQILYLYRTSASCGLDNNCLSSGEMGETGRDQGHAYEHLLQMAFCAEVFWAQGVDVFSLDDNRLLACGEYWSRNNMNPAAPYITFGTTDEIYWNNSTGTAGNSAGGYFAGEPMACNILRSAYVVRKGLTAPWMVAKRYATAGTTVVNSQGENENSFCYLLSADTSTAAPPPAITYPSVSTVTTGLINTDIGSATPPGRGFYKAGRWTVSGAGTNTWTQGPDSCHFVYKQLTGNCAIIARVDSVQNIAATSKAGVMIRDSLSATAGNRAWVAVTASSTFESDNHGWTQCYGGSNWETHPRNGQGWEYLPCMPYWVKLERVGNTISTYISRDGTSWEASTVAVFGNMPSTAYVGLFVCSLIDGSPCTATFSDVSVTGGDGGNVTVPPPPYAIYASPDAGQDPLRWLKSFGATRYTVCRSTTNGGPYTPIATVTNASYIDTNLLPNTTYYYVVTASNSAGTSGYSPQDSATTSPVPAAPTGLAVWTGDGLLRLGWTASSAATTYKIWRGTTSGGPYTLVGSSTSTSYLDSGLTNGTTYYYVVTAVSATGQSAYSTEISGMPSDHVAISINFQGGSSQNGTPSAMASAENAGWVIVRNWNNAASSGTNGSMGSLTENDGTPTSASTSWSCHNLWSTPIPDNPGDYRMMKGYLDSYGTSVSTVSVSGLPSAFATNVYEVFVYFDGDNGANERTAYYTIGNKTITATDAAGANYGGKYVLANNSAGNCMVFYNLTGSSFTLSATGNPADGTGARAPINGIEIVAQLVTNAPSAPTGLTAVAGNGQAILSWNPVFGATSYSLKRSFTSGTNYVALANLTGTSFTNRLVNGQTYYYVVSAANSYGESTNSVEVSVTPSVASGANVSWSGAVNGTWDVSTANWLNNGSVTAFQNGDTAIFDDSASGNTGVTLSSNQAPAEVIVTNTSKSYSIGGSAIVGTSSLTKSGSGTLTLSGANTFSGGVTNRNGTIILAASTTGSADSVTAGPLGIGTLTLNGGAISADNGTVRTNANAIFVAPGTVNIIGSSYAGQDFYLTGALGGSGRLQNQPMIPENTYTVHLLGNLSQFSGTIIYNAVGSGFGAFWRFGTSGSTVDLSHAAVVLNGGNAENVGCSDYSSNIVFNLGSLSGNGYFQGSYQGGDGNVLSIGYLNTDASFSGQVGVAGNNMDNLSLVKVGTGTQWLTGSNVYTGQTTVSNGELVVSTAFTGGGSVFVNGGAAFGITNVSMTSALVSNLTTSAGSELEFQKVASTGTPLIAANSVMINGSCVVKITGAVGLMAGSSYPLISYSGALNGFANLHLQMPYGWRGTLVNSANQIVLTEVAAVATAPPPLSAGMSNGHLQINWPADHTGWRLLMNTNLADTNWVQVSGASGTNVMLIASTNSSSFFRLVYP